MVVNITNVMAYSESPNRKSRLVDVGQKLSPTRKAKEIPMHTMAWRVNAEFIISLPCSPALERKRMIPKFRPREAHSDKSIAKDIAAEANPISASKYFWAATIKKTKLAIPEITRFAMRNTAFLYRETPNASWILSVETVSCKLMTCRPFLEVRLSNVLGLPPS